MKCGCIPRRLVHYSPSRRAQNLELRKYLDRHLYFSPQVDEANTRAVRILAELFKCYIARPHEIGEQSRRRIRADGLHRAACDYLAGKTDRYVMQENRRLFGINV